MDNPTKHFEDIILPQLDDTYGVKIDSRTNRYTLLDTPYGNMDFYPESDKIMFHNPHKWIGGGLAWITENIIPE